MNENFKKMNEMLSVAEKIAFVRSLPKAEMEDVLMTAIEETDESEIAKPDYIEFFHAFDDFYKPLFESLSNDTNQRFDVMKNRK